MRYKAAQELADGLRELADFVETVGPKLPVDLDAPYLTAWVFDDYKGVEAKHWLTAREKMRRIVKLVGKADKVYKENYFDLRKYFGPIKLEFTTNRANVCERKVVGTKEIPEHVVAARTEDIVEWVCNDPLLRAD